MREEREKRLGIKIRVEVAVGEDDGVSWLLMRRRGGRQKLSIYKKPLTIEILTNGLSIIKQIL